MRKESCNAIKRFIFLIIVYGFFCLYASTSSAQDSTDNMNVRQKQLAQAFSIEKQKLDEAEQLYGPDHPALVDPLQNLAMVYLVSGKLFDAKKLFKKALSLNEKHVGVNHPSTAKIMKSLAGVYIFQQENEKAKRLLYQAIEIINNTLGSDHPALIEAYEYLSSIHLIKQEYEKAEQWCEKALTIAEKSYGSDDEKTEKALRLLTHIQIKMGRTPKALPQIAKEEKPRTDTQETLLKARIQETQNQRNLNEAISLYKELLTIKKEKLGPDHLEVAFILSNLALLYDDIADFAMAEQLNKKALEIRERKLDKDHPDLLTSLNNLASIYIEIGDYAKALSLLQQTLIKIKDSLGKNHSDNITPLSNLALVHTHLGNYSVSKSLFKRVLELTENTYDNNHPQVGTSLNSYATICSYMGDYELAESLYKRALAISEKNFSEDHHEIGINLNNLALMYFAMGDNAKAEPLFQKVLPIFEKAYGKKHPNISPVLLNLASLYESKGNYQKAYSFFKQAIEIDDLSINHVMSFTSENQKLKYILEKNWAMYGFFTLAMNHEEEFPGIANDALDIWLKRKGIILESQKQIQTAITRSDDPDIIKLFQQLAKKRSMLSKLVFAGPGDRSPIQYQKHIERLTHDIPNLESQLSRLSHSFALNIKTSQANSKKLSLALPSNSVLIEIAKITPFNFNAKDAEKRWGEDIYIAFVLHAGTPHRIEMINLGRALTIDNTILALKKKITTGRGLRTQKLSKQLHDLVFKPLKVDMADVTNIFISPDGNLNLIPFEVMMDARGKYLIEKYTFNYLTAGRDMLGFGYDKKGLGKALIIGDPDFDLQPTQKEIALRRIGFETATNQTPISLRAKDMQSFNFSRLPGTRKEVETIHSLFESGQSSLYTGEEALEEVLNQKNSFSIIHLATHGFFLSDNQIEKNDNTINGELDKNAFKLNQFKNPLLRSGIALAGANQSTGVSNQKESDGIVTAEKILGLKLRGTDMVVLSACETGLGDIKSGEGVYGLRRAFTQAGTKSLVMSMWSVPDRETQELMTEFYKNIISRKMNRNKALRQAVLHEMKVTKERYGESHPFYWGSFVFLGEP